MPPDQGRTFTSLHTHSASNHWIATGDYMTFQDYRFAMRARLNLLPTKSVCKRIGKIQTDLCPKCRSAPETLAHVLNACTPNAGLMRDRHNKILQRLVKAIPRDLGECYVEQKVPESPGDLRPDIVIINRESKEAIIIDVTVPFESSPEALEIARNQKLNKYSPLANWLSKERDLQSTVEALVVGSLGSWDVNNITVLRRLRISRKYSILFRKLCTNDAISGSRAIWSSR